MKISPIEFKNFKVMKAKITMSRNKSSKILLKKGFVPHWMKKRRILLHGKSVH